MDEKRIYGYGQGRQSSELLNQGRNGKAILYGVCEGQGISNLVCLKELRELYKTQGDLIADPLKIASDVLVNLANLPETCDFFGGSGFNVSQWVKDPGTAPEGEVLSLAPLSFPLIGLLSLSHFCVVCKLLGQAPGQVRDGFEGVTGHSQGIIAAAAIAQATDWPSYYNGVKMAMTTLFWIGFQCHHHMPFSPLSLNMIRESIEAGDGSPSPMLSIRGLDRGLVQQLLDELNTYLFADEQLYICVINSRDNMIVAGAPSSLCSLNVRLRAMKAAEGLDQSKVVFNHRKPFIRHQFLPMSSAFHCPHSEEATESILDRLGSLSLSGSDFGVGVFHTSTGDDLRKYEKGEVITCLVRMITADPVNWPKVMKVKKNSSVVEFGQGRLGSLVRELVQGAGVRAISSSELLSLSPSDMLRPVNWEDAFRPQLKINSLGVSTIETKMTRLLGVPPVMVAGMTPTTVPWDVVASITKAGYHVELATGGYLSASILENAIVTLAQHIPPSRGITCNIIYANPKAVKWQIPLIQDLVERGFPIEGLTIGAGVPSAEIVEQYIKKIGLRHISFKPGSIDAILNVVEIAKAHPDFPIGLQWTGGRAGGHHSFEDFNTPMLETYAKIRQCDNIVLIAGSGFGGADDTIPYLTGNWSKLLGYPAMPFDGVLLGSRMMVAEEAHTSSQAKALIVQAPGVSDSEWHTSYSRPTGGILTVKSEMGQPIHKLATSGVLLWSELDQKIFSIGDRSRRLLELQKNRSWIIEKLNRDFQKPWFAINSSGNAVELEDLTYFESMRRLVTLMYVQHQRRWIDASYRAFVVDFVARARERLSCASCLGKVSLDHPNEFLDGFLKSYPDAETELLHPEDISYFVGLCSQPGRKPVNFIPRLDDNFEIWFKKDSLWQAEDIDAVPDRDVQRVCIIQGPVAARHSKIVNEPAKKILDDINDTYTHSLLFERVDDLPSGEVKSGRRISNAKETARKSFQFPLVDDLPNNDTFQNTLLENLSGWAYACVAEKFVRQGGLCSPNPIRAAIVPTHGHSMTIEYWTDGRVAAMIVEADGSNTTAPGEVLRVTTDGDEETVLAVLTSSWTSLSKSATLQLRYKYCSNGTFCKLSEDMNRRNSRIKEFYSQLWLGSSCGESRVADTGQTFKGPPVTLTDKLVHEFSRVLGSHPMTRRSQVSKDAKVPLDISIMIAWEALVKPLLSDIVDFDLLQLLHRSNQFKYKDNAEPMRIGDELESSSRIQSIKIQNGNKLVEVGADIQRNGTTIVEIVSTFFCKGPFTDYENTVSIIREPDFGVRIRSERERALLMSRQWLQIFQDSNRLIGKTLRFLLTSQATFNESGDYSSLRVSGDVLLKKQEEQELIGRINFERGTCHKNPVVDFLNRYGTRTQEIVSLPNSGFNGQSSWTVKTPSNNSPYGCVSKDTNPIHVSPVFARFSQLPGIVNHGMCTSALVSETVVRTAADGDKSRIRRWLASFEAMVLPGNKLRIQVRHVAMVDGRMLLEIHAYNDESDEKVLDAQAEVEQASTAYVFTGQGSQDKAMGMDLYDSSAVARSLWDSADRHLHKTYGFSIIDIVRNDPKSLTVFFGGARGRAIRDNYLAMTVQKTTTEGRVVQEPIIKGLTPLTPSYTFADPRGLLYSTQFAQPALILAELATFVDLESKGMIQKKASYAGHSLGEYSALGSLARVMAPESLVSLAFYRGLIMQVAMERDQEGRTEFSMLAANPSRVSKYFDQDSLAKIVKLVSNENGTLLEIVNFNVRGRQYVCAGHLKALWTMTQVLNTLARNKDKASVFDDEQLLGLVRKHAEEAFELAEPIELEQGIATTPLRGIDIPFHSTSLRNGIPAYRKYLESKILEEDIDLQRLKSWIPNVTAKPFSTSKEYVEEAAKITRSETLRELLDHVNFFPNDVHRTIG